MVSFQCEGCGDVQTKKKLDSHRNHCRAPFTCIDCMKTFHGTDYRSHTSCMTEDQKYQGHLYREKPTKANKRKSVSILEPTDQNALIPHKPYVEDVPEYEVPPEVPTPPSAVPARGLDSVFDYMVEDEPQGAPRIMFTEKKEDAAEPEGEMTMKNDAPSVFNRPSSRNESKSNEEQQRSIEYDVQGYSYGAEPLNQRYLDLNGSSATLDFMTPAAKSIKSKLDKQREPGSVSHSRTNSASEKKRKRAPADDQSGTDTNMADAPHTIIRSVVDTPAVVHSGLTGGLSRMVTNEEDYPFRSPDSTPEPEVGPAPVRKSTKESPGSPLKRTRRSKDDSNGLGISLKDRAGKVLSMVGDAFTPIAYNGDGAMVRTRRRTSSGEQNNEKGEKRERKKHKVTRHNGTSSANVRYEPRSRRQGSDDQAEPKKKVKAIEYHKNESNSDSDEAQRNGADGQMVVFGAEEKMRERCESFLSYVTKGPHSTSGYSVNKALKRWHRSRDVHGTSSKVDEEKELWRGLRLKKNDRGEIVVFF